MFDTLTYAKRLEATGVSRDQAETHIQIMAEIMEKNFATKSDIRTVLDEIQKSEYRLVIKCGVIMTTLFSLAIAVFALRT